MLENGGEITLVEFQTDLLNVLKKKYPMANIKDIRYDISGDGSGDINLNDYDVILCNPPYRGQGEKALYMSFFAKIINDITKGSVAYFIAPISLSTENLNTEHYVDIYNRYGKIDLENCDFNFNKSMINRMIKGGVVDSKFFDEINGSYCIKKAVDISFLGDIKDFERTKIHAGLFKIQY